MLAALLLAASGPATTPPTPADPLTVTVDTADADRFAALFARTGGAPTAEQLQREYLDPGSYGVHVFTQWRIENASHLAEVVAAKRAKYADAIARCLPLAKQATADLRTIYLALHGLFPDKPLPRLYIVFGADSSGGTAGPGAQVLGLEVLCAQAATPEAFRTTLRAFFAHETVHALQRDFDPIAGREPMRDSALVEGAADFIATLVTGAQIAPARDAWARRQEPVLWRDFAADMAATRGFDPGAEANRTDPRGVRFRRWFWNYGDPPAGWPIEAGYWIGQRIWERWYATQPDKHAAIRRLLSLERLDEVLADAGTAPATLGRSSPARPNGSRREG